MHDLMRWLKHIPLRFWLVLAFIPLALIWRLRKPLADRCKSRMAENWPTAEGCAIYAHVTNAVIENKPESYCAYFTYYFSLNNNGETEYYSGEFSHIFSDEEMAQKWLDSLKEKKIPIRVKPGAPNVSAVLLKDLITKFPLPIPSMLDGRLEITEAGSKLPYLLLWPTEMMASLIALGFCLGLVDHLFRVLSDRPLYPKLAISLLIGFAVVVIPFEFWFHRISGGFSFDLRKSRNKGRVYLRILTHMLNFYVAANWLIDGTHFAEYFQLHRERLDPMWNGAFLTLLLGNYAASLYGRLETIEKSPVSPVSMLHPE
ncbi:MAG: hypothetical protein WCA21_18810 [Terracidiphilus sp.]